MQQIKFVAVAAVLAFSAAVEGNAARAEGSATAQAHSVGQPKMLFALIYRPGPKWQPGKSFREQIAIKEHYAYVKGLFARGVVFSGGGMGTENGLVLLYAHDQAEADSILAGDPMVQAGSFTGSVMRHTPAFLTDKPLTVTRD